MNNQIRIEVEQDIMTESEVMEMVNGLSDDVQWIERCRDISLDDAIIILKINGFSCKKIKSESKANVKKIVTNTNGYLCLYCNNTYSKKDFNLCPHCGGDGGNLTKREWKPNKRQRKEFAKKMSKI